MTSIGLSDGNVGIGTTIPLKPLYLTGNAIIVGSLDISGDAKSAGFFVGSRRVSIFRLNDPTNINLGVKYFSISTGYMSFNNIYVDCGLITKGLDNTTFTFNRVGLYKCIWVGYIISNDTSSHEMDVNPVLTGSATYDNAYASVLCLSSSSGSDAIGNNRIFFVNVSSIGATMKINLVPSSNVSTYCRFKTYGEQYYVRLIIEYMD